MGIFDRVKYPALAGLIRDQRLKELVIRQEVRITEEYLHREFISKVEDEELQDLRLSFSDGFGEVAGRVKKRLFPLTLPFSVRFSLAKVAFTTWEKTIYLRVEQVRPMDLNWVTGRVVGKIPGFSFSDGVIACDLTRVPRLTDLFAYELKGRKVADFFTVKDLSLQQGELVARLGVLL